jgi:hypothetical protein
MTNLKTKTHLLLASCCLFLFSCDSEQSFFELPEVNEDVKKPFEHYISKLPKVVCDPLDEQAGTVGGDVNSNFGLEGDLFEGIGNVRSFSDMIDPVSKTAIAGQSVLMDAQINMSQLNIPTRAFDTGFVLGKDNYVEGSRGQMLTENFGMVLRTRFQLADLEEGHYEFALISDDGSALRIRNPDELLKEDYDITLTEMDYNTSTRMSCSNQVVKLTKEDKIPMEITYFQGPRYHIALMLLMRKVEGPENPEGFTQANPNHDVECGMSGNSRYFDSNNDSSPQSAFEGLIDRGWFIPGSSHYLLPSVADVNYCVEGTNITIDREECFREDIKNFDVSREHINFLQSEVDKIDLSTLSIAFGKEYLEEEEFTVSLEDELVKLHISPDGSQDIRVTYCLQD